MSNFTFLNLFCGTLVDVYADVVFIQLLYTKSQFTAMLFFVLLAIVNKTVTLQLLDDLGKKTLRP